MFVKVLCLVGIVYFWGYCVELVEFHGFSNGLSNQVNQGCQALAMPVVTTSSGAFQLYSLSFLQGIGNFATHHQVHNPLPLQVCLRIRELKLHHCRKRGKKGGWNHRFKGLMHGMEGHQVHRGLSSINYGPNQESLQWIDTSTGPRLSGDL